MEAPPAGGGAAGLAAGAAVHRDPLSPSAFVGVEQLSFDNFAFIAPMNGRDMRVAGFNTAAAAADGYDECMRVQKCPFVNTPKHPGEMQAVPVRRAGDGELISPQPEAQKKPVSPPVAAAAPAVAAAAPAAPRLFKGVTQNGRYSFLAIAQLGDGVQKRLGSYGSAEAAARAYDAKMREHKRHVVNFPQLPGEIQAVYGELEQVTLARHAKDPNRVVNPVRRTHGPRPAAPAPSATLSTPPAATLLLSPPAPAAAAAVAAAPAPAPPLPSPPAAVEDTRQYKGVSQSSKYRYGAFGRLKEALGHYDTAKEAADAYDVYARKTSGGLSPVVNTPLHPGEIQAVPGEADEVTRRHGAFDAARGDAQPLRASRRAAGLPAPKDALALTPKKRKPSDEAPEDAGAGGYATDDDDDAAAAAPAEPEPERMPAPKVPLPAPVPPAPQQALALAPMAPAPAAAIVMAAGGDDDDLVAFLRGISPPLADIDRVAATAAGSGVQMSQLRDAVRSPPAEGASRVNLAADILGIRRGADKLILLKALWQLA